MPTKKKAAKKPKVTSFGQFDQGAGQAAAGVKPSRPKRSATISAKAHKAKQDKESKARAAKRDQPSAEPKGNSIRNANQVRQDMKRHRSQVTRLGANY
jgi:hypothetical protein